MMKKKLKVTRTNGKNYLQDEKGKLAGSLPSREEQEAPSVSSIAVAPNKPLNSTAKDSYAASEAIFRKLGIQSIAFEEVATLSSGEVSRWDARSESAISEARDSLKVGLNFNLAGIESKVSVHDSLASMGNYMSRTMGVLIPA